MPRHWAHYRAKQYSLSELLTVTTSTSHFPFGISLLDVLATVVCFSASSDRDFNFGAPVFEIHLQRDDG